MVALVGDKGDKEDHMSLEDMFKLRDYFYKKYPHRKNEMYEQETKIIEDFLKENPQIKGVKDKNEQNTAERVKGKD